MSEQYLYDKADIYGIMSDIVRSDLVDKPKPNLQNPDKYLLLIEYDKLILYSNDTSSMQKMYLALKHVDTKKEIYISLLCDSSKVITEMEIWKPDGISEFSMPDISEFEIDTPVRLD